MHKHRCHWVLSKEFKGSSVFLLFTGQANQPGTSFKLGSKPSSCWIQDIQFFILLYLRQEKTALAGTALHPMLPAHPELSRDTAAVSEPWGQKADHRGMEKQHGQGRVKVWGCHAAGNIIPCRTEQVSLPLHRSWCLLEHRCSCWHRNL